MLSDGQSWARLRSLRVRAITLDLQYIIHTLGFGLMKTLTLKLYLVRTMASLLHLIALRWIKLLLRLKRLKSGSISATVLYF
jgi:hypothetical protein